MIRKFVLLSIIVRTAERLGPTMRSISQSPNRLPSASDGLSNVCELTGLMGRWQKLQATPLVICDTGHNVGGWTYLSQQIKHQQCKQKRIVFGMVDDKDLHAVMSMLPDDAIYYWTQPSTHRAFPVEKVAETADDYDLHGKVFPTVLEAYQAALQDADEQDLSSLAAPATWLLTY